MASETKLTRDDRLMFIAKCLRTFEDHMEQFQIPYEERMRRYAELAAGLTGYMADDVKELSKI